MPLPHVEVRPPPNPPRPVAPPAPPPRPAAWPPLEPPRPVLALPALPPPPEQPAAARTTAPARTADRMDDDRSAAAWLPRIGGDAIDRPRWCQRARSIVAGNRNGGTPRRAC